MAEEQQQKTGRFEDQVSALRETMEAPPGGFTRTHAITLVMVGLVVALGLGWLFLRDTEPKSIPIQIMPFESAGLSQDESWQLVATEQALIAYLEASGQLRLERVDTALKAPENSAADWRMSGHLSRNSEGGLLLRVELQSLSNEYTSFAADVPGMPENLNDIAMRAASQVYAWSGQNLLSEPEIILARAEMPVSANALRYLSEGRAAFAVQDDRAAIDAFERAAKLAGPHPLIYNELARAWERLGYRPRAIETAEIAYENRDQLSRQRQLEIEAQYFRLNHDWKHEQEVWLALKSFHPDALDYRLALTEAYLRGSDIESAEQTINEMKAMPAPMGEDLRIDLIEAEFWYQNGHFEEGRAAAERALDKARESGEAALLGEAILQLVDFMHEDNEALLEEAERIFLTLGNHARLAEVYGEQGKLKRISGELESAEMLYTRAISLARDIGDEANVATLQNGFSIVYDLMGRQTDSLQLKQNLAAYFEERGVFNRFAILKENIGISYFKLGRLAEAEAIFKDVLPLFEEVDDAIGVAWSPYHISRIRSRQGRIDEAQALADQALINSEENPEGDLAGNTGFEQAHLMFFRGELEQAIEKFEAVKERYLSYENTIGVAEADLMLARIYLRLGRLDAANQAVTDAITVFDADALPNYQIDARTVKLDLVYKQDRSGMSEVCQEISDRIEGMEFQEFVLRAETRLVLCDVTLNGTDLGRATSRLADIRQRAAELGLFEPVLHTHLIEVWIGNQLGDEETKTRAVRAARELVVDNNVSLIGYLDL
ncbi:MAG: hypothetical protein CMK09_11710 [Ponticaulis sp.]|nr:hypothetical protein [Ponticaulis sp.]|tara:strand:- start:10983 stop:13316 length:2334 start_codon:yes stop_codon:yes gene_type:complete